MAAVWMVTNMEYGDLYRFVLLLGWRPLFLWILDFLEFLDILETLEILDILDILEILEILETLETLEILVKKTRDALSKPRQPD